MIGPIKDALRKDIKPFATPEDSFEVINNALQWRGRVIRRTGYTKLGVLANGTPVMGLRTYENFGINLQTLVAFDTTQAYEWTGTAFAPLPSVMPVTWSGTDTQFFWTINYANAFWATNSKPGLNGVKINNAVPGAGITTITTAVPHGFSDNQSVAIINIKSTAPNGADDINGGVYVITVTGPTTFEIPFQTASTYASGGIALNSFVTSSGQDGIRYYGILTNGTGWANYNPPVDPNNALAGCLLMFAYRGYLVFLNTWEGNEQDVFNYPNRARWTQIGTPYYSEPVPTFPNPQGVDPNAARDDLFGRGGANDAPTNETIVAASFIRDILVVYFERSTWRLRFVNNAQNPFVWERINVELGSDCTFSTIPFDKGLMAIGNRGIVISDGNDTIRFDEKIPDEAFNIRQANDGLKRVYGIRTFRTKLCFWTYPSTDNDLGIYPDKVLVYNYDTKNWSYFLDSFTCFGYIYPFGSNGITWNDLPDRWSSYGNTSWNSGISQEENEFVVAGNQQGYVFQLSEPTEEGGNPTNDPSLAISGITNLGNTSPAVFTSNNHNLSVGTWITLTGITTVTSTDGVTLNGRNYKVTNPTLDANTFMLQEFKPIRVKNVNGTSFTYIVTYKNILPGSAYITVGLAPATAITFTDPNADGNLVGTGGTGGSGTIDYSTGLINLTLNVALINDNINIRIVSLDPLQGLAPVFTTKVYPGGGEITVISGIDIQTKIFNFFGDDQRSRLSKIDFYTDATSKGQFTINVFADSSNEIVNTPLPDNPFSNVVLTSPNPYQIGQGDQAIYRLYCDVLAQTVQLQLTLSDAQMAVNSISQSDIEILAMMFTLRRGGRLP